MALTLTPATGPVLDQILRETYPLWGGGLSFEAIAEQSVDFFLRALHG